MLYRKDIKNDNQLSALGFGAMRFPTKNNKIDYEKSWEILKYAIDNGINYIDTAYPYHRGQSEEFLGTVLSRNNYRNKVYLATKLPHWFLNKYDDFEKTLDIQLSKLQTDYIDYYLIHMIAHYSQWENLVELGIIDFIEKAKKSGKIRNIGFSSHADSIDFKKTIDSYNWDFCQIQFNFLDEYYQAGIDGLKYAYNKDIPVIIMEPLRGGSLVKTLPEEVKNLYNDFHIKRTPASWALRWIWNHKEVTTVLSGMSTLEQVKENIETASSSAVNSMSEEEQDIMDQVKKIYKSKIQVNCTGCRYCMPCPAGVNIPTAFEIYNNKFLQAAGGIKYEYLLRMGGILGEKSLASQCINCGKCVKVCPQKIDIPTELKKVSKEFETKSIKISIKLARIFTPLIRKFMQFRIKRKQRKYNK